MLYEDVLLTYIFFGLNQFSGQNKAFKLKIHDKLFLKVFENLCCVTIMFLSEPHSFSVAYDTYIVHVHDIQVCREFTYVCT